MYDILTHAGNFYNVRLHQNVVVPTELNILQSNNGSSSVAPTSRLLSNHPAVKKGAFENANTVPFVATAEFRGLFATLRPDPPRIKKEMKLLVYEKIVYYDDDDNREI